MYMGGGAASRRVGEVVAAGESGRCGAAVRASLGVDVGDVPLDRVRAQ